MKNGIIRNKCAPRAFVEKERSRMCMAEILCWTGDSVPISGRYVCCAEGGRCLFQMPERSHICTGLAGDKVYVMYAFAVE